MRMKVNINEHINTIAAMVVILFFISKCSEVEKSRHENRKPTIIYRGATK